MDVQKIQVAPQSFKGAQPQAKTDEGQGFNIDKKKVAIGFSTLAAVTMAAVALYKHKGAKAVVKTPDVTNTKKYLQTPEAHEYQRMIDRVRTKKDIDKLSKQITETEAHLQPEYRASRLEDLKAAFVDTDKVESQITSRHDEVVAMMEKAHQG